MSHASSNNNHNVTFSPASAPALSTPPALIAPHPSPSTPHLLQQTPISPSASTSQQYPSLQSPRIRSSAQMLPTPSPRTPQGKSTSTGQNQIFPFPTSATLNHNSGIGGIPSAVASSQQQLSTASTPSPFLLPPQTIFSTNLSALSSLTLSQLTTSELLFKARLALQAERYEEMVCFMRLLVLQKTSPLTLPERGYFSLSYKKLLSTRRMGWRYFYSIEMKEKGAVRKCELEIVREGEKEKEREAKEKAAAAAAAQTAAQTTANKIEESKSSILDDPLASANSATTIATTAAPTSLIPSLQARLAQLHLNLQQIHSYRYQLFYESALLINASSSLIIDKLLPKLLTPHAEHTDEIFARWIPGIIEQLIVWERKKTSVSGGGGGGRTKATVERVASGGKGDGSKEAAAAVNASTTAAASSIPPLALPGPSSSSSSSSSLPNGFILTRLDTSRHWTLETEFELQLRALDDRTRWLTTLRSQNADSLVFYVKMLADQRRLLAEFLTEREYEEGERVRQSLQSLSYYVLARFISLATLTPFHPVRLGLELNFSVFSYELLARPDRASQMASSAYDLALNEYQQRQMNAQQQKTTGAATSSAAATQNTQQSSQSGATQTIGIEKQQPQQAGAQQQQQQQGPLYDTATQKDSLLIMQLLKNNLNIWAQAL